MKILIGFLVIKYWTIISFWYSMQILRIDKKELTTVDRVITFPVYLIGIILKQFKKS